MNTRKLFDDSDMFKSLRLGLAILACVLVYANSASQTVFRGTVLDSDTQKPISSVKVGIPGQGVGELTNAQGRFLYRKYHQVLDEGDRLQISAKGYQSLDIPLEDLRNLLDKSTTIYLNPLDSIVDTVQAAARMPIVLWDASSASKMRNPEVEMTFLNSYLRNSKIPSIQFIAFNENVIIDKTISIPDDLDDLIGEISELEYRGVSDYNIVNFEPKDEILLFSENPPTFGSLYVNQNIPVQIINSVPDLRNKDYFIRMSTYTSGNYIDLSRMRAEDASKFLIHGEVPHFDDKITTQKIISGTVTSARGPVHYATISKVGSLEETYSEEDGSFEIAAHPGDEFKVMYLGKFSTSFTVTQQDTYTIYMEDKSEVLEEVVLSAKKSRYSFDPERNTEIYKGRTVPVRSLGRNELKKDVSNASELINGEFGVVSNSQFTVVKGMRAEWVVDGVVKSPSEIRPSDIIRISVFRPESNMPGIQAGPPRAKIIVTTKRNKDHIDAEFRRLGYTLLKNNDYNEQPPALDFNTPTKEYVKLVSGKSSSLEKWNTYKKLIPYHRDDVDFYVDMSLYFQSIDTEFARSVRSDFALLARNNVRALRILAYLHEYAGAYLNAQKVYERILYLAPNEAQSYRDLALVYQETGEYRRSMELYVNMLGNRIKGIDFSPLEQAISNELQHLILLHKHKIDYSRLPNDWLSTDFNIDIRMVMEWSHDNVPFEFQFVDPNRKYFNWRSKTYQDDSKPNIKAVEEFIVDDAPKGEWIVNVRYNGETGDSSISPYLKYTLYKNYGQANETKTIKLVKLDNQIDKVTLDTFLN